jgi:quercetin dioxygenase-like cupin family protein
MRLFSIPGGSVEAFSSVGVLMQHLPPVTGADTTSVHVARVAAGGSVGRHRAVRRQAFAVLSGSGTVQVDDDPPVRIGAGTLVVWETGELHQTWATTDLLAVIVETSGELTLDEHFPERRAGGGPA